MEGVGGGVLDRHAGGTRFVQVPDAGVVGPDAVGVEFLARLRGAVPHREFRAVRHAWEAHPHERLARRIPRVDFIRNTIGLGIDEADVHEREVAPVGIEVGILEAADRGRKPHEDGEVRLDFLATLVTVDLELHAAREFGDGRIGARQILRPGEERREEKRGECKTSEFFHCVPSPYLNGFLMRMPVQTYSNLNNSDLNRFFTFTRSSGGRSGRGCSPSCRRPCR